ncbi:MAG: Ppx/GppA family phosphatase, partial [Pseudomonadota bacterium]
RSDRARAAASHIIDWTSLQVGVVTLGERFGGTACDAMTFDRMTAHVQEQVHEFAEALADRTNGRPPNLQILGTSGTITTLAGVHMGLQRYSRPAVDGYWFGYGDVSRVIGNLRTMTPEQRAAIPCVGEDRSTHLMSGAAILRAILRAWPVDRVRVADRGLREGMLYGLMQESREGRPGPRHRR